MSNAEYVVESPDSEKEEEEVEESKEKEKKGNGDEDELIVGEEDEPKHAIIPKFEHQLWKKQDEQEALINGNQLSETIDKYLSLKRELGMNEMPKKEEDVKGITTFVSAIEHACKTLLKARVTFQSLFFLLSKIEQCRPGNNPNQETQQLWNEIIKTSKLVTSKALEFNKTNGEFFSSYLLLRDSLNTFVDIIENYKGPFEIAIKEVNRDVKDFSRFVTSFDNISDGIEKEITEFVQFIRQHTVGSQVYSNMLSNLDEAKKVEKKAFSDYKTFLEKENGGKKLFKLKSTITNKKALKNDYLLKIDYIDGKIKTIKDLEKYYQKQERTWNNKAAHATDFKYFRSLWWSWLFDIDYTSKYRDYRQNVADKYQKLREENETSKEEQQKLKENYNQSSMEIDQEIENLETELYPLDEENKKLKEEIEKAKLKIIELENELNKLLKSSGQADAKNAYAFYLLIEQVKNISLQNVEQVQNVTSAVGVFGKMMKKRTQSEMTLDDIIEQYPALGDIKDFLMEHKMIKLQSFRALNEQSIEKNIISYCKQKENPLNDFTCDNIKNSLIQIYENYDKVSLLLQQEQDIKKHRLLKLVKTLNPFFSNIV